MTNTDALEVLGQVSVTTSVDLANSRYGEAQSIAIPFDIPGGNLYVAATTSGTPTFSSADAVRLRIGLQVESIS